MFCADQSRCCAHRQHRVARGDEHRKEARERDDRDLGIVAEAEQQEEHRQEGDLRHCEQKRHQWIEEVALMPGLGRRRGPTSMPEPAAESKADADAKEADRHGARQFAVAAWPPRAPLRLRTAPEIVRQRTGAAEGFPGGEHGDRDDPMLDGDRGSHASSSARVLSTSSRSKSQIFPRISRYSADLRKSPLRSACLHARCRP